MERSISAARAQAKLRAAAQKSQREFDRVNREVNRVNQHNACVNQQIHQPHARIKQDATQAGRVVIEINQQLRSASRRTRAVFTPAEQALTKCMQHELIGCDDREWNVFLSFAPID